MAKLTKGHKQVRCYADGGKVKSEYGKPSYAKSVAAKVAGSKVSDGYNWFPKARDKMKAPKRMYINSARQKMLDET